MKIAFTGTTGFVGSNLLPYFQNLGYLTFEVSRNLIFDEQATLSFNNSKVMVHLAGKAHDLKKTSNDSEFYETNYMLTKKVYDAFLSSDAIVFISLSSVKASADKVKGILTELNPPNPVTHYGKSKLLAEEYIFSQEIPKDKRVYVLRPCMIHGPVNKGNLNLLYKIVSKKIPWPLGSFDNKRSFCSIDNLMFIIKEIIEREDIPSGIYHVADDEPLSTNELINLMAISQNRKSNIWKIPKGFIYRLAKLGDVLYLPLNTDRLQKLTDSYIVSNQKIKDAIGKPLPVSSRDGLLKTFKTFKHL